MISIHKKYQTKDQRQVRLYAVDSGGRTPVHGAIWNGNNWESETWDQNGLYNPTAIGVNDLVPTEQTGIERALKIAEGLHLSGPLEDLQAGIKELVYILKGLV